MRENVKYPEIKAELRDRQAESQALRRRIHAASGMDRWDLWEEKRLFGATTRKIILAYAFLRKVPYLACEVKCLPGNVPVAEYLHEILTQRGHTAEVETIQTWLETKLETAAVAA